MAPAQAGKQFYYAWFEDPRWPVGQRRYNMDLHISMTPGDGITGHGKDSVGDFELLNGELTAQASGLWEIGFVKRYSGHGVLYRGTGSLVNSVLKATGRWHLEDFQDVSGDWECHLPIAPPPYEN